VAKILRALKMFPVYRVSEGVENLEENYSTFKDCIDIFKKNGIVLIFSEGKCINEWHLRPLKKGTARLALDAWAQNIPLQIIPLGINYHSFSDFGKIVHLNFGEVITKENVGVSLEEGFGAKIAQFNSNLKTQLQSLVVEIKKDDKVEIENHFKIASPSSLMKILLFLPAIVGYIFHAPLYMPIKKIAFKKFSKIDHYDSVVVGLLFLLYPFYLLAIAILFYFFNSILSSLLVFIILPFCAWAYTRVKNYSH
jgi:1-acyl-sn-glycerol-3-phosphate acyltransferase